MCGGRYRRTPPESRSKTLPELNSRTSRRGCRKAFVRRKFVDGGQASRSESPGWPPVVAEPKQVSHLVSSMARHVAGTKRRCPPRQRRSYLPWMSVPSIPPQRVDPRSDRPKSWACATSARIKANDPPPPDGAGRVVVMQSNQPGDVLGRDRVVPDGFDSR
jgi:hypothetical protein